MVVSCQIFIWQLTTINFKNKYDYYQLTTDTDN